MLCWSVPADWQSEASHLHGRFEAVLSGIQKDVAVLRSEFAAAERGLPTLSMVADRISASVSRVIETKPKTGSSSQPTANRPSLLQRLFSALAPRPAVRIDRKQYEEIALPAKGYLRMMADANHRVNKYLAAAIGTQPTPVQWARAIKMQMCPNDFGVLESAQKVDSVLQLRGSLANRFARLVEMANRLDSVGLTEECIGPARAIVSEWPSVMRMLDKIEKAHVKG
jgi:hypothetical protein